MAHARSRSRSPRRDREREERRRSPPPRERTREADREHERDSNRDRGDRPDRRDRERDSRSPRKSGPPGAGGAGPSGRRADEGYGAREREAERAADRERYEKSGGEVVRAKSPEKPNFANSGLLAKESNSVKGVALKYHEPPEARKPSKNWRLYVFKGDEQVDLIHIYRQSCYLVGRDQVVADIPVQHPSISKQHAVLQFRQTTSRNEYGDTKTEVKPYVLDLDSTNGTSVNGKEVPKSRYYELLPSDVIKFGTSSREYVLLHEEAGK